MKKRLLNGMLAAAFLSPLALPAAEPAISIQAPYVRLPPPGIRTTAGFMCIRNAGADDRLLLKAESPAAGVVELHNHIDENGVMKMRPVPGIAIRAHGQTELKPGGYHLMLMELKAALKEGGEVPITLHFDDGSRLTVLAPVRRPGAEAPAHGEAAGHGAHAHGSHGQERVPVACVF